MSPTVDVIVGGHSHTLLYTGPTPNGDTALGEYPTVVTQANGHRVNYFFLFMKLFFVFATERSGRRVGLI